MTETITIKQAIEAGRYTSESIVAGGALDEWVVPTDTEVKRLVGRYIAFGRDIEATSGIRETGPLTFDEARRLSEVLDEDGEITEGSATFDEIVKRFQTRISARRLKTSLELSL